jgi:hypothetical protein
LSQIIAFDIELKAGTVKSEDFLLLTPDFGLPAKVLLLTDPEGTFTSM